MFNNTVQGNQIHWYLFGCHFVGRRQLDGAGRSHCCGWRRYSAGRAAGANDAATDQGPHGLHLIGSGYYLMGNNKE